MEGAKSMGTSAPAQERCSFAGRIEGFPAFGSRLHAFIVQKIFRIEPCETPKFRIQAKVERPGKEKVG